MFAISLTLLILHSPDGYDVRVSPEQITSLHSERTGENRLYSKNARCLVRLTDGTSVAVKETCEEVQKMLEGSK